jgi:RES domain-containing protein
MTKSLWRIAAVTLSYNADDLSGAGAKKTGGRWNSIGMPVVYCSQSIAMAVLETVVHLRSGGLPLNRYLVRIDVPDKLWTSRTILNPPPVGWDAQPHGLPSVQAGDTWKKSQSSALLSVPSVLIPEECNVIINTEHPDAPLIAATMIRKWDYDPRFL